MPKIFLVSGTTWSGIPTDGSNLLIEALAGGGGGDAISPGNQQAGGGGAAYATLSVAYTSGTSVSGILIGTGGGTGGDGGLTKWNTSVVVADFGQGGLNSVGGRRGRAVNCTPTSGAFDGGDGANANLGGGGGGAAGPNGAGIPSVGQTGGNGDNNLGGAGGASGAAGANGTEWDSTHGSGGGGSGGAFAVNAGAGGNYGAGGGGNGPGASSPGNGAQGLIVITYTVAAAVIPNKIYKYMQAVKRASIY